MSQKLDPRLAEIVERGSAARGDISATVDVLVGLDAPLDQSTRADLEQRGLTVRSDVGTVLTGSIKIRDVLRVAASPHVQKIEASAPLYRESNPEGG